MRHETKKICRIVDEITTIFLKDHTNKIEFTLCRDDTKTTIEIIDYDTNFDIEYVEYFVKALNGQRQAELEEYFWQLAGETDEDDELTLISNMVDEASAEIKDGVLYVKIVRNVLD